MSELKKIYNEIKNHKSNRELLKKGYSPVYTASATSKIVIIGQAPGRKAQESGIPWNDASGDRLRKWLGIDREVFYNDALIALVPMDFYYPGKGVHGDLPPRKEFAHAWHEKIFAQMLDIKMIVLVGNYAQKYYLQKYLQENNKEKLHKNLTDTVKNYKNYLPKYFVLVHPSPLNIRWLSKNKWFEEEVILDLQKKVASILKRKGK